MECQKQIKFSKLGNYQFHSIRQRFDIWMKHCFHSMRIGPLLWKICNLTFWSSFCVSSDFFLVTPKEIIYRYLYKICVATLEHINRVNQEVNFSELYWEKLSLDDWFSLQIKGCHSYLNLFIWMSEFTSSLRTHQLFGYVLSEIQVHDILWPICSQYNQLYVLLQGWKTLWIYFTTKFLASVNWYDGNCYFWMDYSSGNKSYWM